MMKPFGLDQTELPASFLNARNLTLVSKLAEADTANAEFAEIAVRSTTNLAAIVFSGGEFLFSLLLNFHRSLCHDSYLLNYLAKGAPMRVRSSFASSSVVAVVTKAISMPLNFSTLSYSISGKMSCSLRPRE
jgi:hypothetical protein